MIFGENWSFVQNPKAASSSVAEALLPFCAPVPPKQIPFGFPTKHDFPTPGRVPHREHRLGVVRNPFDRMVSAYCYIKERRPEDFGSLSFEDFVFSNWNIGSRPGRVNFCTTPQVAWLHSCNVVLRIERLSYDLNLWSNRVLGCTLVPPRTNTSARSGGWAGYYTPKARARVEEVFAMDIELFGYWFGT